MTATTEAPVEPAELVDPAEPTAPRRFKSSTSCRVCHRWLEGDWNRSTDEAERAELNRQMGQGACDQCLADAPAVPVQAAPHVADQVAAALAEANPAEGWETWEPPAYGDAEEALDALQQAAGDADRAEAERMASWLASIERRRARIGAPIQVMLDELETRLATLRARAVEIDAPFEQKATYVKGWLAHYALHRRELTKDQRRPEKSQKLLHVTIKTSETGGGWEVDPDLTIPYLFVTHPDAVDVTPKVKLADVKRIPGWHAEDGVVVTADGEVVPGITVKPKSVSATVEVVDDGTA